MCLRGRAAPSSEAFIGSVQNGGGGGEYLLICIYIYIYILDKHHSFSSVLPIMVSIFILKHQSIGQVSSALHDK